MQRTEQRHEWRNGWPIVAYAAAGLSAGPFIYQYISSLFIAGMVAEFHWSRTQIGSISGMMAAGAFSAPIVGYCVDRFGLKPVMLICTILVAFAYTIFIFAPPALNSYRLGVGLVYFFGVGCGGMTYSRIVNQWFEVRRGAALAISASGITVGAFAMPLILDPIIHAAGWRAGYAVLAAAVLVICLPAVLMITRAPSPLGRLAPGPSKSYGAFVFKPAFWLILLAVFLVHVSASAVLTHFIPVMTGWGLDRGAAVKLLSLYAVCAFGGRLGAGFLLDGPRPTLVAFLLTAGAAIGTLLLLTADPSWTIAVVVVALLGIQMGAEFDLLPYFVARYIGLQGYSSVYGIMTSSILLSSGLGTQLYGFFYDQAGNYSEALGFTVVAFLMGAFCFLSLGWMRRVSEPASAAAETPAE